MTSALLVIDVQKGLCTGRWAAFEIDRVIGNINSVAETARAAGAPVLCIQRGVGSRLSRRPKCASPVDRHACIASRAAAELRR
jgi:nicotinamidase-related amidase